MHRKPFSLFWNLLLSLLVMGLGHRAAMAQAAELDFPDEAGEIRTVQVQVTDTEGNPLEGVQVKPWALRCSQGHGAWRAEGFGNSEPPMLKTDGDGMVEVPYPRYALIEEKVRTTQVTLSLDHPKYNYVSHENVDMPLATPTYVAKLERGVALEIEPRIDGKSPDQEGIYVMWSDGRSWEQSYRPKWTSDGAMKISSMPIGKAQVLLVKLEGERATHFSAITEIELPQEKLGETVRQPLELQTAIQIRGSISNNIPRPVINGRIKLRTLSATRTSANVDWFTWAPIAEDGSFLVDSWPEGETAQIIGICQGHIAKSGAPPAVITNPRDPDPYWRPQVFSPEELVNSVILEMEPMVPCEIQAVDAQSTPISKVHVLSNPNVGWWHGGSQIYCSPLVRGERRLVERSYRDAIDEDIAAPFQGVTNSEGKLRLFLPVGNESLYVEDDRYEMPVLVGRRRVKVDLVARKTTQVQLKLQSKGTEELGDWDKLSGILFGCSGPQCRKLLDDPLFVEKMTKVRRKLDEGPDPDDPVLLEEAYANIADAFEVLGDQEEASVWRVKAADQAARQN